MATRSKTIATMLIVLCTATQAQESSGKFSAGEGKTITFAKGNLQYQASSGTWRFAEHQYDVICDDNENISKDYDGWIDLFGWATSGYDNTANDALAKNYQPWSTSYEVEDTINNHWGYGPSASMEDMDLVCTSAKYDWGVHCAIENGGNKAGLWRTPTHDEWAYIFFKRKNASRLFGTAIIGNQRGLIILPDDFETPAGMKFTSAKDGGIVDKGGYFHNEKDNNFEHNKYTLAQWSEMEKRGAIFLPASGYRFDTDPFFCNAYGLYWSSTHSGVDNAYNIFFSASYVSPGDIVTRRDGRSVRLVKDVR